MFDLFKCQISRQAVILILGLVLILALSLIWLDLKEALPSLPDLISRITRPVQPVSSGIKTFVSEEDFKDYLQKSSDFNISGLGRDITALEQMALPNASDKGVGGADRVSETNVQVAGIDEPDIVKTDGKEIYFSKNWYDWRGGPIPMSIDQRGISLEEQKMIDPAYQSKIVLINAFPPADLKVDSEILKNGNLLLSKDILLVFSGQNIFGFDVADSKNPKQKWSLKLDDNAWLATSRLKDDKVYLIVQTNINQVNPCPLKVLEGIVISCQDIYHPVAPTPIDSTFTVMVLNPDSGKVEKSVSFVGANNSVVYMSNQAVYLTYSYQADMVSFMLGFIKEKARDIYPLSIIARLEKLAGYDLSQQTKMMEMEMIISNYQNSLDSDEKLKLENELANRIKDYMVDHLREIDRTGLVKIGLEDFRVLASGVVPGHPLNQFSLDEYDNHLRIAMTVGQSWWGLGISSNASSTVNDVYVLDNNLRQVGSIQGLGLSERIYAARFAGDRGYLVTFRQTDPFYVLDLSKPNRPLMAGELKIPGYSSYLEPISADKVLGIGQEDWQVKISLFDVSSAANPREIAKYTLSEGWSEVLSNHHAFLLDPKHEIFFVPGGQGGYIFSYKNDDLEMKKAIHGSAVKRAIYLNDYLYIIGQDKIVVLNELDWTRVAELDL